MFNCSIVMSACVFAAEKHKDQRRKNKDKDPYINHCLEVANTCLEVGCNEPAVIVAAVLHDTIEDTQTTKEEIIDAFSETVCDLVMQCTDDKKLDKVTRKKLQIEHAENASEAMAIVKMADKYSNLRLLHEDPPLSWSPEVQKGYVWWSFAVVMELRDNISNHNIVLKFDQLFRPIWKQWNIDENVGEEALDRELQLYYDLLQK